MKRIISISPIIIILLIIGVSGCVDNNSTKNSSSTINLAELTVSSEGYGIYHINGIITTTKDYSYLEMVTKWYDASGTVIERNPLSWNTNDIKAGEPIRFEATAWLSDTAPAPAKVDILIFDSPFAGGDESGAIYKTTLTIS